MDIPEEKNEKQDRENGASWTFAGYHIEGGQIITALAHFYRGEMTRSNVWRTRLDATTNWAVVTAGVALTATFGNPDNPHFLILLVILLLMVFLGIEARRYRYYELWAYRIRLMETDFYAAMLVPPFAPSEEWAGALADSLLHPDFTISRWEAFGRRFRRNYVWILTIIGLSWIIKLFVHPTPTSYFYEAITRAAIGPVPGYIVASIGTGFCLLLALMGILTATLQESTAEVLPPAGQFWHRFIPRRLSHVPSEVRPKFAKPGRRSWQQMTTIITNHGDEIAHRITGSTTRGVTKLSGVGMYTGEDRDMLICAVPPRQVYQIKAIIRSVDPDAFVIVNPAEEIAGKGFAPL